MRKKDLGAKSRGEGKGRKGLAALLNQRFFKLTGGKIWGKEEVEKNLRLLYVGSDVRQELDKYYEEKTALLLKILLTGLSVAILAFFDSLGQSVLSEGYFLPRRETAYEAGLRFSVEGGTEEEIQISVEPQAMTREESREFLKKLTEEMEIYILGDNRSLEEVRSDLKLLREIEGTSVTVSWELNSYEVMNLDGSLRPENLKEEGTIVELTAVLGLNGEEAVYRACAKVLPPILSAAEVFAQKLEEELVRLDKVSSGEERRELPARVQGKTLIWKEKRSFLAWAAVMLTFLTMILTASAKDRDLKQKTVEREQEMLQDYSRIVSKLVLLMGAGATMRSAWDTVVRDYQDKKEKRRITARYAYEEMALTSREMQNGTAEARAYENFGERCRIPCYLKLSALLEQNLKKGNKGLTVLLKAEVREAFEQRKELARCRGEEASTRMLLPMILMLVVVMTLILVPAGMSMQI